MDGESSSSNPAGEDDAARAKRKATACVGELVGGRYLIEGIIALGGMGAVFRAEHVHMRKRVALKLLHPSTENLPELVARFERESIVGSHVSHPNVCAATDFGRIDDGSHYLVLEFVEGRTLHEVLKDGPLPPARAAEIARQIAEGLGAAHELGIYHRDVKPSNLMLVDGPRLQVKIVDFGLAKLPAELFRAGEQISVTSTGSVFGTVAYMAPELARGMQAVDHRSDLYALGIILFEMLAGKHPFEAPSAPELFRHHRYTTPPAIVERSPGAVVPPGLEAVVRKLIEKDPGARYQSADALIEDLDAECPPAPSTKPVSSRALTRSFARASARASGAVEVPDPSDASPQPAPATLDATSTRAAPPGRSTTRWLLALAALGLAAGAVRYLAPEMVTGRAGELAPASSAEKTVKEPLSAAPFSEAPSAPPSAAPAPADPPSAAPEALSAAPASPELTRLRGVLHEAAAARDATRGAHALVELAQAAPAAFREPDVIASAAAIAVSVELGDRSMADQVFSVLDSDALGAGGPEVLFHVTSFAGGSRGATRAATLLARPEVIARATPALRIARDLKSSTCKDRPPLLERAVADGDERALALLVAMVAPECSEMPGACCASFDPRVTAAIAGLRERLRK